jgi:uncharacterized protein YndB with AHSA1/START domain
VAGASGVARRLTDSERDRAEVFEGGRIVSKDQRKYEYEIFIGAAPEKVWQGLTEGDFTQQYVYGTRLESSFKKGSPYAFVGNGFKVVDGEILEIQPNERLAMTWRAHWDEAVSKDPASRVTYNLLSAGSNVTKLGIVHDQFEGETATYKGSVEGWPLMLSSLKTLLESGKPLPVK